MSGLDDWDPDDDSLRVIMNGIGRPDIANWLDHFNQWTTEENVDLSQVTWLTKNRQTMLVSEMSPSHRRATWKMLCRHIADHEMLRRTAIARALIHYGAEEEAAQQDEQLAFLAGVIETARAQWDALTEDGRTTPENESVFLAGCVLEAMSRMPA